MPSFSSDVVGKIVTETFKYGIGAVIALWLVYTMTHSIATRLSRVETVVAQTLVEEQKRGDMLTRILYWQGRQAEIALATCLNAAGTRADAVARCQASGK